MRKILLIIVMLLLIIFGYFSVAKGTKVFGLEISSIMQIDENSKNLDKQTEELNSLIDVEYPKKRTELDEASKRMQTAKQRYLDETNLSTDEEIQNSLQVESYDIERLYVKLGVHANEEGVNIKFVLKPSSSGSADVKNIEFTVDGTYIGITNFVYAIEDDEELDFRIYNFKLLPYQNEILRGTFTVRDVRITSSSLNENLTSSTQTTTQQENTNTNTENTNTTNTENENKDTNTQTNTASE